MNEKITVIITITVMGIAFWYGLSGDDNNNINQTKKVELMTIVPESARKDAEKLSSDVIDTNLIDAQDEISDNEFDAEVIEINSFNKGNNECDLNLVQTDNMKFKDAFKYYRLCNGSSSDFVWQGRLFITSYKDELLPNEKPTNTFTDKKESKEAMEITISN